jgi:hypothetical protein
MSTTSNVTNPGLLPPRPARFFVTSGHGGGWLIFREGIRQAIHRLPQKLNAVETAKTLARSHAPSEVMVEQIDGSLTRKYAFDSVGEMNH